MKRFAILCTSLAILASASPNAFAQSTLANTSRSSIGSINNLPTNIPSLNTSSSPAMDAAAREEVERQQRQAEKERAAFSKEDKLQDPSYVRRRIQ